MIDVFKAILIPDGKYDVGNHKDSHEREAEEVYVFHTYYLLALLFIHSTIILFSSGVCR